MRHTEWDSKTTPRKLNLKLRLIGFFLIVWGMGNTLHTKEISPPENQNKRLKVLHLSFHKGCIQEFVGIGKQLAVDVESWFIPDLPPKYLDGVSQGNALYNITHERAENIWKKHKKLFDKFDVILISDTAPLSRIFLQNDWKKPLIIWVCNRFDYCDRASLDGDFPDQEYYDLFRKATKLKNVFVIPYTSFERYYAKKKGIEMNSFVIAPCYPQISELQNSSIPSFVNKKESFFLPSYHNETKFMDLSAWCSTLGIKTYCGRYNGPLDLKDFKGIIHLPYNWSNLAFFENIRLGTPYFVPSQTFIEKLISTGKYFHADLYYLTKERQFDLSEWYSPVHRDVITYFDSWEDLKEKIETINYVNLRKKVKAYGLTHYKRMLDRWMQIFQKIEKTPRNSEGITFESTPPFIVGRLAGQLGNQFFIIAATMNLALKHGATPLFPDFISENDSGCNLKDNYEHVFHHVNVSQPSNAVEYYYREPQYSFSPIPYHENMEIRGWFQSEKYFQEHKQEIMEFFSPSAEILNYLRSKYADIIDDQSAVAIHVRSYLKEDPTQKVYVNLGVDYYENAMSLFPKNTLFVVFSQHMQWCKEAFSNIDRNIRFIEGESHYHDLYLMSLCKHNIICNSTFSWWGAYLNKNPTKKVIAPKNWFSPSYEHDTRDLIPKEWIRK